MKPNRKIGCEFQNRIRFLFFEKCWVFVPKMLGICPQNVELMNFQIFGSKNVGYLSPDTYNIFIYSILHSFKNVGYLSPKSQIKGVLGRKMLGICPQMLGICPQNVGYLSPKHTKTPKCWVFVAEDRKMLGICPRNVGYLSPTNFATY